MIVGAGLAGLIAAHAFPSEQIYEMSDGPAQIAQHKALLRFRSPAVGELTGIEFTPVKVRKGIWMNDAFRAPDIALCNHYSQKVIGELLERSIWNLDAAIRYIAPEDFYERLIEVLANRINWASPVNFQVAQGAKGLITISTAPLPVLLKEFGIETEIKFTSASITVDRFRIPGADVYQTVYFPDPEMELYRASITGDLLIAEYTKEPKDNSGLAEIYKAFGLKATPIALGTVDQKFGKIVDIPPMERRRLIAKLTNDHNVFSLGRFATWRNILLDDVVHDASIVKRLMNATKYERNLKQKG